MTMEQRALLVTKEELGYILEALDKVNTGIRAKNNKIREYYSRIPTFLQLEPFIK